MSKSQSAWSQISIHPLSGTLDTRSRPADIGAGSFRYKGNMQISVDGKLSRRGGHARFFSDALSSLNYDLHFQNAAPREPITMAFGSVGSDGVRRLFGATQSRIYLLNDATGIWQTIATGQGAYQSRFHAAELQDRVLFTNGVNDVMAWDINAAAMVTIPELTGQVHITKAKVIIQFNGIILLMNIFQDGKWKTSSIQWCDLNDPLAWDLATPQTLAGFQDLDYGDDIQAACLMSGSIYIFTKRSIWRCLIDTSATSGTFSFTRVYTEPKNQTGCIAYPNTLICTGTEVYYAGRDAIYRYDPYIPEPVKDDWLWKAFGTVFRKLDTALDTNYCQSPVMEYEPATEELWFSWPSVGQNGVNNQTIVAQVKQKTADIVDTGYTCFVNWQRNSTVTGQCNEVQNLIGASGQDYCLKEIGAVFYREYVTLVGGLVTNDIPTAVYLIAGYNSILRGLMPLGFVDREKVVRRLTISLDATEQDVPCALRLRIGNTFNLQDPNDTDDVCAVQWSQLEDRPMSCPTVMKISELTAKGLKPFLDITWAMLAQNRFLYYEITVTAKDHSLAIGGDAYFNSIDIQASAMPAP